MHSDFITVNGVLTIEKFTNGVLVEKRDLKNLVVQVGKSYIASRMIDTTNSPMSHMAVGTNSITPVSTDTSLGNEIARVALASTTNATNVNTYIATFPAGIASGAWTEAGIFNGSSSGIMLCRTTFAVVNKGVNDSITITWNITIQ